MFSDSVIFRIRFCAEGVGTKLPVFETWLSTAWFSINWPLLMLLCQDERILWLLTNLLCLCLCLCLEARCFCGCSVDWFKLVRLSWISGLVSIFFEVDRDHVCCPCLCSAGAAGAAVRGNFDLRDFVACTCRGGCCRAACLPNHAAWWCEPWLVCCSIWRWLLMSCRWTRRTQACTSAGQSAWTSSSALMRAWGPTLAPVPSVASALALILSLDPGLDRDLCLEVRAGSSWLLDDLCLCLCLCLGPGFVVLCAAGGLPAVYGSHNCFFVALLLPPIHPGVFYFLLASSTLIYTACLPHLVLWLHFP